MQEMENYADMIMMMMMMMMMIMMIMMMMMMIRPGAATAHRHVLVGGFCSPPPTSLRLRD